MSGFIHVPDEDEVTVKDLDGDTLDVDQFGRGAVSDGKVFDQLKNMTDVLEDILEQLKIITGA